ncbi:MAG TPA: sulfite oxidase [Candidatus Eisenbacteria bacterium]
MNRTPRPRRLHAPGRREFLIALASAGAGGLVLGSLPPWARRGLAAGAAAPDLIERNAWPEHWETTVEALGRSWITSNERFFVRSHFPAPDVDPVAWRLEIAGLVRTPLTLSLAELRALPRVVVPVTLECAGNGRALYRLPSTSGTQWERGAVGTASWAGVRLATLLERAGVQPEARHVWFEAVDEAPLPGVPKLVRSLTLEKASSDVLLAYEMNGKPLPRLHGAPLRAIVPGWYGVASTKWLTRVRLEASPSDNHFMVRGYRYNYPGVDPAQAEPVQELRIKSLITRPLDGARVPSGRLKVEGFAWGGRGASRVEVSSDGGTTWRAAGLVGEEKPGAWRAWTREVESRGESLTLMARATGRDGQAQPLDAQPNAGGYGNNSIHRISVHVGS